jgi:RIO kinase 1
LRSTEDDARNGESELPEESRSKAIDRADRRLTHHERESRFLVKRSEDYDVFDNVFDVPTLMAVNKLRSNGVIQYIKGTLGAGKESNVYIALAPDSSFRTVKIYLTVSAEFKKRIQYIAGDPRFSAVKRGSRNLMSLWAKKEFKNMQTAHAAGIRVPEPIAVEKNILVMEFIGDSKGNPSPSLLESEIVSDDYYHVIEQLALLYQKARLVHADLSEYNIFKTDNGLMFFDFGSAVDIGHPNSKQFLIRDVININRFFAKRGIEKILDTVHAVDEIIGETKQ